MRRPSRSRLRRLLPLVVAAVLGLALAVRTPLTAGYRDLGVFDALPAGAPPGMGPSLVVSQSKAETETIWRGLDNTLRDRPSSLPGPPDVDYAREVLVLATYFSSSSCAPSLSGVEFRAGAAIVQINDALGLGGCTADAVPYTFAVAIARDRISAGPPDIRMTPTAPPLL